jgi:hypothetical protein
MEEYAPQEPPAGTSLRAAQPLNRHTAEESNLRTADVWTPVRTTETSAVQPYLNQTSSAVQPYQDSTDVRQINQTLEPYAGQTHISKAEKVKVTVRMHKDNVLKFKDLCYRLNIDLQEFLEAAAVRELNRRTAEGLEQPSYGSTAHDDMMMFKTEEDIIMAYESMTGNKWNRSDDRMGRTFNTVDPRLIDIAIATCIDRKLHGNTARKPIKSFAYFTGEIQELLQQEKEKALPTNLPDYHRYVMNKWRTKVLPLRNEKWTGLKS